MRIRTLIMFITLAALAACGGGSGGATSTEPPLPTAPATGVPTPTVEPAALPAPVLFLSSESGSDQIWRLDVDGVTLTRLTGEAAPVIDFDASPVDGRLAYISDNDLIVANADGSGRAVLVDGSPLPAVDAPDRINTEMRSPRWSPDGKRIAYGLNGVNVVDAAGGEPVVLQQSDPVPLPPDYQPAHEGPIKFYWPNAWSLDGSHLLIDFAYFPEAGGSSVIDASGGGLVDMTSPEGVVCCNPSLSIDEQAVYFANHAPGFIAPGLWRADAATGESETLIQGIDGDAFNISGWPRQLSDGRLYYFFARIAGFPETYAPLSMYRAEADGSDAAQLRSDTHIIGQALWMPDGSGAVIVNAEEAARESAWPLAGPLVFLKSDGSPAIELAGHGHTLRWGK